MLEGNKRIINEEALLEDTAELITQITDLTHEEALAWLKRNLWFMENVTTEMYDAQSNYISESTSLFKGAKDGFN